MHILETKNVSKKYILGQITVEALKGIDLFLDTGEFLCIMGPSGSGKTTLLNLMGLLDSPSSGEVFLKGIPTHNLSYAQGAALRSKFLGFVFQSFNLFPVLNAFENVEYPLLFQSLSKKQRSERVLTAMGELGIEEVAFHRPSELSGGQRQRVAIARALVTHPLLILADEPTANLDSKSAEAMISSMQNLNKIHKTTFVFSTHDPRVMKHASRIIELKDGAIQNGGAKATVTYLVEKHLS